MDSDLHSTPLRQYALQDTTGHRWSVVSAHSAQSANSFPTYGLIKVSNSDQGSSCDSFSLVSPQGSAYRGNSDIRTSPRALSLSAFSQSKTINPFQDDPDDTEGLRTPKTPLSAATATFQHTTLDPAVSETTPSNGNTRPLSLKLPLGQEPREIKLPEETFERIRYTLDRVIAAYHSEHGVFLTDRFFMNKQLFVQNIKGVPNGSVKIGIIQEITSLLRRFILQGDDSTNLTSVEATLHYYDKLMDAFDVFAPSSSLIDEHDTTNDQHSLVNSVVSPLQKAHLERTNSRGGDTPSPPPPATPLSSHDSLYKSSTTSSTSASMLDKKKTNRGSFIFDKFKSAKSKRRSMLSLDQNIITNTSPSQQLLNRKSKDQLLQEKHHSQPIGMLSPMNAPKTPTHARSISVSTSASSRSMRDLCQLPEYMALLESLYYAVDEAYEIFAPSNTHEALDKVISFLDTHVMVFVMKDITALALKMMKENMGDYC